MNILVVGLNHRTAPVELREKLAFTSNVLTEAYAALKARPGVREGVILSTCNRCEVYAVDGGEGGQDGIAGFLAVQHGLPLDRFASSLYTYRGRDAVAHLFRVTCGLDSMLLGETQILGQVRDAYALARECGTLGKITFALFEQALNVGKRAHSETAISQNAVSVSYAAVELAKKVFSSLDGRSVMIIGAGEMGKLTARHLVSSGVREVIVANRTLEKATEVARQFGGTAVELKDALRWLQVVDVVISSTGAPHILLRKETIQEAMRARRGRPLFLFDIAVPRDIDPAVQQLHNVFLYDIDDLQAVVEANLRERQHEARNVERIIEEEVRKFEAWFSSLDAVPLIRSLRDKAEAIRRAELERALARLPELTNREREVIEAMTATMVNKILNDPTQNIKELASSRDGSLYLETAGRLFNLRPTK